MHAAPAQRCPATHAAWPPQVQSPAVQPSAMLALHDVHALPDLPHSETVGGAVHAPLKQQPLGQLVPSHTHVPPEQRWPTPQAAEFPQRH